MIRKKDSRKFARDFIEGEIEHLLSKRMPIAESEIFRSSRKLRKMFLLPKNNTKECRQDYGKSCGFIIAVIGIHSRK